MQLYCDKCGGNMDQGWHYFCWGIAPPTKAETSSPLVCKCGARKRYWEPTCGRCDA